MTVVTETETMANYPLQSLASGILATRLLEKGADDAKHECATQEVPQPTQPSATPCEARQQESTDDRAQQKKKKQQRAPRSTRRSSASSFDPLGLINDAQTQRRPRRFRTPSPLQPQADQIISPEPRPMEPEENQRTMSSDSFEQLLFEATPPPPTSRVASGSSRSFLPFRRSSGKSKVPPPPCVVLPAAPAHHHRIAETFCRGLEEMHNANNVAGASAFLVLHSEGTMLRKMLKFLSEVQKFQDSGKQTEISLGYHYTNQEYLPQIRQHGLLTRGERRQMGIQVRENGLTHGDGVYTSSNPFAFRDFRDHADAAVLLLRLSGNTYTASDPKPKVDQLDKDTDTLSHQRGIGKDLTVLRTSAQCLVLGEFLPEHLDDSASAERLMVTHGKITNLIKKELRGKLSEEVASKKAPPANASAKPRAAAPVDKSGMGSHVQRFASLKYGAPRQCLLASSMSECSTKVEQLPDCHPECCICFEKMQGCCDLVSLKRCGHVFHKECLRDALKCDGRCPICRTVATEPQGKMPSGKMTIGLDERMKCEGFENENGTWRIRYSIKEGIQKPYHENPGVEYSGTVREAFLPNNEEGRQLLKRLAFAFSRGLTFSVGKSLTSGKENTVIWASIHHKTKTHKSAHGYPDSSYFANCNEELDALGVPSHDDPSLHIVFGTRCLTSVNFGYLFAQETDC